MPSSTPEHDFPRAARLIRRAEFDRVFATGQKAVDRALVVYAAPSPEGVTRSRLGLSVGRRVGDSPTRSRVKRCLREAFRRHPPQNPPLDVVVIARPRGAPRSTADARAALGKLLRRLAS